MIQLSNLTKSFGDRVLLDDVTWQITDRERVGLCGPNGAGKTTLLRMMAALDEPDSGAILKPGALTVGYLPQDGLSHAGRTVFDEATNHLDLEARNWLETYLNAYPYAVILVSHDRFFLDAVVTRIADLTLRTLTDYAGNYSDYLVEHHARIDQLRKAKREQDEEVGRVNMFIDRFRYQATKASQVQSRIKMLEKVVPIEVPPERKKIHFNFPSCAKSGRTVLELKNARKAYGDLVIFSKLNLHIERGDRIALVGPNGVGKSTLMRMLSGEEPPDSGERIEGHHLVMQYFAQDEATRMDPAPTVYETLASGSPNDMVPAIRNILGGFLFSGDDVYKKVRVLSGGERTRLAVARMLLRPSNTLLLDEPTNHLDLDSKDVLLEALEDYGGTLMIVSHDRYFVERLATKIVDIGRGAALVYPGTYPEFLWHKEQQASAGNGQGTRAGVRAARGVRGGVEAGVPAARGVRGGVPAARGVRGGVPAARGVRGGVEARPSAPVQKPPIGTVDAPASRTLDVSREERKRMEAERRKKQRSRDALSRRIADLESLIADREAQVKDLEAAMSTPGFYENHETSKPAIERHQSLMWEVGDLIAQWEALQEHATES